MRIACAFAAWIAWLPTMHAYAGKPQPPPAERPTIPNRIEKVALLVDALIVSDISGKVDGIYISDYNSLMPFIANAVKEGVEAHGYEVTLLHANAGLFANSDLHLVYAEKNKSSGKDVVIPFYDPNPPNWVNMFLHKQRKSALSTSRTMAAAGTRVVDLPESAGELPVDAIVVLTVSSRNIPTSKTLGMAAATGLVVGIGEAMAPSPPGYYGNHSIFSSGAFADLSVIDIRDGAILWRETAAQSSRGRKGGTAAIRPAVRNLLERLPRRETKLTKNGEAPVQNQELENKLSNESPGDASTTPSDDATDHAQDAGQVHNVSPPPRKSIFADSKGWSLRDARLAYRAGNISAEEMKAFARQLKSEYREALIKLADALKTHQIDEHEHDIEYLKLQWIYNGF